MAKPEEPRDADHLVEPLFAGLSRAGPRSKERLKSGLENQAVAADEADPWSNSRHVFPLPADLEVDPTEEEPSTARLMFKAVLILVLLVAAGTFVYLTFGV